MRALQPPDLEAAADCTRKPVFAGDAHDTDQVAAFLLERNQWADKCEICCRTLGAWGDGLSAPAE